MVTTTRRSSEISCAYEPARGGVDVLERPSASKEYLAAPVNEVEFSRTETERKSNLDKILNYDRYAQIQENATQVVSEAALDSSTLSDEDIRPTSTTMQFGDDIEIRKEINKQSSAEHTYHLNKGGKIVVSLYALVVAVVLALIVLNTGVLAKLSHTAEAKAAQLSETVARYNALCDELDAMSDSSHIIDVAENEYGMVRK